MDINWNELKLQQPPYSTWCTRKTVFDVKTFLAIINKAIEELESVDVFHIEAAFLSRLIYRMKKKFRNDKGLKNMEKMNKVLINYLNMALIQDYKDFKSYIDIEDVVITLPSRQLLEYILVRTQGFAKLMERLEQVARYSAHFLKTRIKLGHAWSIALMAYAVVSRIWILSRQLIWKCCAWYKGLYQYVDKLEYVGLLWIPKNQQLPCDLKQWLSIEWMHSENKHFYYGDNWDNTILKLIKTYSIDCDDTTSSIVESDLKKDNTINIFQHNVSTNKPTLHFDTNDIGEVINRKTFSASLQKVREYDAGTSLVKKRERTPNNSDIKMIKKPKNTENKQKIVSGDIRKVKLKKLKQRKK